MPVILTESKRSPTKVPCVIWSGPTLTIGTFFEKEVASVHRITAYISRFHCCYLCCFVLDDTDVVGVSHRGERVTPLDKISPNNSPISTASTLFLELISSSWKVISGNTIDKLLLSFRLPTIATVVVIKLRSWRWTILSINVPRIPFTITANCKFCTRCHLDVY